ncbi:MAG: hypothetical protein P8018_11615 [Acidobacteriota bacterium]
MSRSEALDGAKGPVDLLEEAFVLLRGMPLGILGTYFIGALPFMLGLLYCWDDMRRGAFASDHLPLEALLMGILFLWMKGWQGVFIAAAMERLKGGDPGGVSFTRAVSIFAGQGVVQATGLFVLPAAACLLVPFGWTYAFYQSFAAVGTARVPLRKGLAQALRQAGIRPGQNHAMLGILLLFSGAVFLNLLAAAVVAPWLVRSLLGIESPFTRGGLAFEVSAMLPAVTALSYLCLDPVVKCAYALRCFYGLSRRSGDDLRVGFAKTVKAAAGAGLVVLCIGLSSAAPRAADAPPRGRSTTAGGKAVVSAGEDLPRDLNTSIDRILKNPDYSWRSSAVHRKEAGRGFLAGMFHSIGDVLNRAWRVLEKVMKRVDDWLRNLFGGRRESSRKGGLLADFFSAKGLLILLILLAAGLLVYLVRKAGPTWLPTM